MIHKVNRFVILSILLLGVCGVVFAQESRTEICVGFRVGSATLDSTFGENTALLAEIVAFLEKVRDDDAIELVEVSFWGFASPEGSSSLNMRLATERLRGLEKYVWERAKIPDSVVVKRELGIAWELLVGLVEKSDMPYKEEVLHVLREVPEHTYDSQGRVVDNRKKQLMELQSGRAWRYMLDRFFGQLRNAGTVMVTVKRKPVPLITEVKSLQEERKTIIHVEPKITEELPVVDTVAESRSFYMALKSNMLYDVLVIPNIGVEFYLGKNWSVAGTWMYGWWKKNSHHRYWRMYGGDLTLRGWFGKMAREKPLTGHHAGVYGQIFTYDVEFGERGYMGGKPGGTLWEKMNYAVGVEYGYSHPIARYLNIDFSLGVGYWGGKYYEYIPLDGHYVWQATKNRHWFGPTKIEISLVWLLGRGNCNNKKKGGVK